jgi:hypothetical protein
VDSIVALSFLQPWLWAILEGHKPVENRSWKPPARFIGRRIALHASAGWDREGQAFVAGVLAGLGLTAMTAPPRGAIVGTARIVGAMPVVASSARGLAVELDGPPGCHVGDLSFADQVTILASPWSFGPWCWLLSDVRKLREPIPAKGRLGLWSVPAEIAARVRELEVA